VAALSRAANRCIVADLPNCAPRANGVFCGAFVSIKTGVALRTLEPKPRERVVFGLESATRHD
jgi:hypothetical protein